MIRLPLVFILFSSPLFAQSSLENLTVEKIMRDPKWMGSSPTSISWSHDSKTVYFNWNPEGAPSDSLYKINLQNHTPQKVSPAERSGMPGTQVRYNKSFSEMTFEKNGDLYLSNLVSGKTQQLTNTVGRELGPYFSGDEKKLIFTSDQNVFSWEIATGKISQLTDFRAGRKNIPSVTEQEKWLRKDQLSVFEVLKDRENKQQLRRKIQKGQQPRRPKEIYVDEKTVEMIQVSPDENYITYKLSKKPEAKKTIVPNYVTTSGFTEDITARSKVGASTSPSDFFVYDIAKDTVFQVMTNGISGLADTIAYLKDYQQQTTKKLPQRSVDVANLTWSDDGKHCIVIINAIDFKDRWIMLLDPATQRLTLLYREHDEAWVGGPVNGGFGNNATGWLKDNRHIWFTSEESGYSHLYTLDVISKEKQALTRGPYEVQQVVLSKRKDFFYLVTNQVHPGEKHGYKLSVTGGIPERLTTMTGAHELSISPDEKMIAFRYSNSNTPWELYLKENKAGGKAEQITHSVTAEFKTYPWREPEIITFLSRDNKTVYGRLYKPKNANGAAVVFVHGAGYLQNAHRWWSSYFREYMFHNLLTDLGYTVLDIDYRASSGYGREWRTGIYRHMGGKDLTDNLDGAKFLIENYNIDSKRIAIYGGSYGGFITLMAMFTTPDVFVAGAALRPVTDWAHYNHNYTGSILNVPYLDSLSYAKSSPIYYAQGLKGALLICHGMVDTNVHFQDAVRLSQRLIELGKSNWELAAYPMEDHAFVEPSSWTDEYKRILKLFQDNLKPK